MGEHGYALLLAIGIPVCILFFGSVVVFSGRKTVSSFLQLIGAGGMMVVVAAHIAEALQLLPWMHWGLEHSAGHYLDLGGAMLGLALFPLGYLIQALTTNRPA